MHQHSQWIQEKEPGVSLSMCSRVQGERIQDINECSGQNECKYNCVNTKGGYNCSCPSGQQGDGLRNGTGCSNAIAFTSLPPDGGNSSKIQYQGISMGIAASLVFTLILYSGLKQRTIIKSREMFFKKNGGLILQRLLFETKQSNDHAAKIFSALVLEKAADNFHKSNIIGEGGYGTVYKVHWKIKELPPSKSRSQLMKTRLTSMR
ncbi:wall-associated receptor kinase 2-like protein [Tanacetum coccineum]|uniref:Wall-associated receptor kinase 2-like protein n=1 Tax=Tanacetum coccineum TaxID=301880 RepID=A0ABQ4ZVW9_9ASTR